MEPEELLDRVCDVLWTQHGGSGLNITWNEAWELEWDELIGLIDAINRRRSAEAAQLKKASRRTR